MLDEFMLHYTVAACIVLALMALWAVMSPRVQDGLVIKVGLGLMALGFFGLSSALGRVEGFHWQGLIRALACNLAGLQVVAIGIAWRWYRRGRIYRIDEWITPPTVVQRVDIDDAHRGSRL